VPLGSSEVLGNNRGQSQQTRFGLGYVSAIDSEGRTIWIADAHRGDGKRFVVHADEKLTAFLELDPLQKKRIQRFLNPLPSLFGIPARRHVFPQNLCLWSEASYLKDLRDIDPRHQ
jgi:hypothetical protein